MKGRIINMAFALLMALVPLSCADVVEDGMAAAGGGAEVRFTLINRVMDTKAGTVADEAGVVDYNENLIRKADIFFYADAAANAVCKISWSGSAEKSTVISGSLTPDEVAALFGEGATSGTCHAYAVVNGPDTPAVADGNDTSIATLKALEIGGAGEFSSFPLESFVMDGQSSAIILSDDAVTGNIDLYRAASKIQLYLNDLSEYTDDEGNVWVPQADGIAVSFHNGVHASRVDVGDANDRTAGNYFSLTQDEEGNEFPMTLSGTTYTHEPFYSYSSDWGRETGPDNEAYLSLRIYWAKQTQNEDGTTTTAAAEPYYYRVPVNLEGAVDEDGNPVVTARRFDRNMWYKINLKVGVLGDKAQNSQIVLNPKYIVVDWSTVGIDATLSEYHYLVVEKNFVEVFNENTVSVGYTACDPVTATIVYLARPNYTGNDMTVSVFHGNTAAYESGDYSGVTGTATVAAVNTSSITGLYNACSVAIVDGEVVLTHTLDNDNSTVPYDHAIYTIVVKVETSCGLVQYIEYRQYPARYIEGELDKNETYSDRGTVIINGYGGNNKSVGSDWYYVNNTLSGNSGHNSNPNMYVITVTSFDENQSAFIIADPRQTTINNLSINTSAPALYGTSPRALSYYYPTRTDNANLIAPKFRTAAAYGRLSGGEVNSLEEVNKRCAAYQEYGYPAGRWRVPTAAELQYLGKLCADGVIPALFNAGITYNSATGAYTYNDGSFTAASGVGRSVRCVYDEWYWSDKCDEYTFTWGDEPR